MKASVILANNNGTRIGNLNKDRKALCTYLKTLSETATDVFWGNHEIEEDDKALLEYGDCDKAFDTACAVLSYKLVNSLGGDDQITDEDIFLMLDHKKYDTVDSFFCCELAFEFGRQIHYIIALKAQEDIEYDIDE